MRKVVTILLVLSFSFSIVHAYALELTQESHCSATDHVHEVDEIVAQDGVCDIHCAFHISFILADSFLFNSLLSPMKVTPSNSVTLQTDQATLLFRPPITTS